MQSAADFQISMLAGGKHTVITSRASPTTLIGRQSDKQEFSHAIGLIFLQVSLYHVPQISQGKARLFCPFFSAFPNLLCTLGIRPVQILVHQGEGACIGVIVLPITGCPNAHKWSPIPYALTAQRPSTCFIIIYKPPCIHMET